MVNRWARFYFNETDNKFLFFLIPDLSCKIFIPRTSQNDYRPCFLDHTPIIPGRRSKGENPGKEFKHPHDFLVSCVTSFPTVLSLKNMCRILLD